MNCKWTDDEERVLRELWPTSAYIDEITAVLPGRSYDSIKVRAHHLHLKRGRLSHLAAKKCKACEQELPINSFRARTKKQNGKEYFYRANICRSCEWKTYPESKQRALARWRIKNANSIRKYEKAYRTTHKEQRSIGSKGWYKEHRQSQIDKAAKYAKEHPEEINAKQRERYHKDPEKYRAKLRAQYRRNPWPARAGAERRRARKKVAHVEIFTEKQWCRKLTIYGHCCAYCGERDLFLTKDHVVPLKLGGEHSLANLVPACLPCNLKKGGRTPEQAGMVLRQPIA